MDYDLTEAQQRSDEEHIVILNGLLSTAISEIYGVGWTEKREAEYKTERFTIEDEHGDPVQFIRVFSDVDSANEITAEHTYQYSNYSDPYEPEDANYSESEVDVTDKVFSDVLEMEAPGAGESLMSYVRITPVDATYQYGVFFDKPGDQFDLVPDNGDSILSENEDPEAMEKEIAGIRTEIDKLEIEPEDNI